MLQRTLIILVTIFCINIKLYSSARILGIFFVVSRSHHSINQAILKSLASKGHEVTILSYFITEKSLANYTEILIGQGESFIDSIPINEAHKYTGSQNYISIVKRVEQESCIEIVSHEYVQNLINLKTKTVDIIIAEQYHSLCFNLLAYKLEVPIIDIIPPYTAAGVDIAIGNPSWPSYLPVVVTKYTSNMNFMQRMGNLVQYLLFYTLHYWYFNDHLENAANNYLNITSVPPFEILHKKVALALYNNHFSLFMRPMAPNAINVAGIHIKNSKPLLEDIQKFIEESEHGVIYFSFGTTMKASSISPEKLKIIKEVFLLIPQRVLWRVDDLNLTAWNFSPNVKLSTWFSQRDVLEHKNVRAFISHCGIFGTIEAIYTSTPVIAIPFMFDQFQDGKLLEEHGAAIYLDYHSLTRDNFYDAINKIINDTKYYENMKKLSKIFKDRPLSPLDEAIYWIEYVIRYNGAPHLRLNSADMPFYRYILLDVILFVLIIFFALVYLTFNLVRKIQLRYNKSKNNKYKIQ